MQGKWLRTTMPTKHKYIYFFFFLNTIVFRLGPGCKFGELTRRGTVSYLGEIEIFENCNSANSLTKIENILTHQSVDHVLVGSNYELEVEITLDRPLKGPISGLLYCTSNGNPQNDSV